MQSKAGTEGSRMQCRMSVWGELVGRSGRSNVPERGALGCPQEEGRDCQRAPTGFADTYGVQVQVRDDPGHWLAGGGRRLARIGRRRSRGARDELEPPLDLDLACHRLVYVVSR